MEAFRDLGRIWLGVFLAIGMMVSAYLIAVTAEKIAPRTDLFTVKGYAERVVMSDFGRWRGQYTVRAKTLEEVYARHKEARSKVVAFLVDSKVDNNAIVFSPVSPRPVREIRENGMMGDAIVSYEIVQSLEVSSGNVELIGRLAQSAGSLIESGLEFASFAPEYYFNELEDLKLDLLRDATANAAARASALAQSTGAEVGMLRSARQGVFQVTAHPSTETAGGGYYDTRAIEKAVKAVVTVQFAIN